MAVDDDSNEKQTEGGDGGSDYLIKGSKLGPVIMNDERSDENV